MKCFFLTPVRLLQVYFVLISRTIQGLYLRWAVFVQRLISTRSSSSLNYTFTTSLVNKHLHYPAWPRLFGIGAYLSSSFTLFHPPLVRASLTLGLIDSFPEFEELLLIPPVATVLYSGMLSLSMAGEDCGMGGG